MKTKILLLSLILLFTFSACKDSDDPEKDKKEVAVAITAPSGAEYYTWANGSITFVDKNYGTSTSFDLTKTDAIKLAVGSYDVTVDGSITYQIAGGSVTSSVRGAVTGYSVTSAGASELPITLSFYDSNSSLVISELYTCGSLKADGKNGYYNDDFIRIYNNTDHVIYADRLAFFETAMLSSATYTPIDDKRDEYVCADFVFVIPGNGTDVPILPGHSIKIADQARNHSETYENYLDNSNADYEWYEYTEKGLDTDNPDVPNLDIWYSYTATISVLNNQALKTYGIARIPAEVANAEAYLADYHAPYSYINSDKTMTNEKSYSIPNSWILDVVVTCNDQQYTYSPVASTLDKSYASCSTIKSDIARFSKSFKRKSGEVLADGRVVLIDNNDSANDFEFTAVSRD